MEIKLALIAILKKYKFVQAPDTEVGSRDCITTYCILRGRIKGTASAVSVIQHQKAVYTFVPCDTFCVPTHTISYLWHGRECCTQNIAVGKGSREQYSMLFCSLDPTPCAMLYSAYSTPSHAITITCNVKCILILYLCVLQVPLQTVIGTTMTAKNGVYLKILPRD